MPQPVKEGTDNVTSPAAQKAAKKITNPLERRQYILIFIIALLFMTLVVTNISVGHWMKQLAGRLGSTLSSLADSPSPVPEMDHVNVHVSQDLTTVET